MRSRRSTLAAITAAIIVPVLAACSAEAGNLEPVDSDPDAAETTGAADTDTDTEAGTGAEMQTVTAEHLTAQVPADWESIGDADGWSYVHQLSDDNGGVAGRIGFMPGGAELSPQEAVDWFISQTEGTGATDDDYAPMTSLRTGDDRANTSYNYDSSGQDYTGVVWAISDDNGIPSLIQLSGAQDVITPELITEVDESLDTTGNWEGTTPES